MAALASLLLAGALHAAAISAAPPPETLLQLAVDAPDVAYAGTVTVVAYAGGKAHAHEARVSHAPDNRYRWEFLSPNGKVDRVVVSDGASEEVRFAGRRGPLVGNAVRSALKRLEPAREVELLLRNYALESSGPETVAGRPAWLLRVTPRAPGKPRQDLWFDRDTGVILQSRRYHPEGTRAVVSRFIRFDPKAAAPDADYALSSSSALRHDLDPQFLGLEDALRDTPPGPRPPAELTGGFVFESADRFPVRGRTVAHVRWTDGLVSLSLFLTDRPVRPPAATAAAPIEPDHLLESEPGPGRVLSWKQGKRYYTLVADLSAGQLDALRKALTAAR